MASAIASLEIISQGRAVLGIGRGDSAVHNIGLRPASVGATRDYILAVRELLEKGETIFQGQTQPFHLAATADAPTHSHLHYR